MKVTEELQALINNTIIRLGYELWGIIYIPRESILRVYIDSKQGITLNDCAQVSRQINTVLYVENLSIRKYTLEISSPGINRPLFTEKQFKQFIGSVLQIQTKILINNQRRFHGLLQAVVDTGIIINTKSAEYTLAWRDIARANLSSEIAK